jgi:MOSC domain-containing protein YiiM
MKVISTNIGESRTIVWQGKEVQTGIYKFPVETPIYLGLDDVAGDHVIDRRYHGGADKACYLYSQDHYSYWKVLYPVLDWQWGMFGENLTIAGLDESKVRIGDVFRLGQTVVRATQPRQPCFKLGVRFGSPEAVKQFVDFSNAGVYLKVLEPGFVKTGDTMELLESNPESFSLRQVFQMIYKMNSTVDMVLKAIDDPNLAASCRKDLIKYWGLQK